MTLPTSTKTFPIHPCDRGKLASVPWEFVAPHDSQAQRNHSQTLARLAERGGLSLCELLAVLTDRDYEQLRPDEQRDAEQIVRRMMQEAKR